MLARPTGEDHRVAPTVSDAQFVKDVGVQVRKIRNDYLSPLEFVYDVHENRSDAVEWWPDYPA